jgi:hypothetical protein
LGFIDNNQKRHYIRRVRFDIHKDLENIMPEERSKLKLYSGGHKGAEAEFGEQAEKWAIPEINISFEGHQMARDKNAKVLNSDELTKGDLSMEIISQKMGRSYARPDKIRRVIQSIYHMVTNSYHIFAVGWIQPDDTIKGGTGWGVELAKMFNRDVSVYDQDREAWFTWREGKWNPDAPMIPHRPFTGTGTRDLTIAGKAAIRDLFQRSFGDPPQI